MSSITEKLKEKRCVDLVNVAIKEYRKAPLTPELLTQTFQTIWQARGEKLNVDFSVTPCPFTKEEIMWIENNGLRLGYLPQQIATRESRHILNTIFPELISYSVWEGNPVTNDLNPSGWFDYEKDIDAPYRGTTEKQLANKLTEGNRKLLSLNQYIIASQDSKLFSDHYLDEDLTWIRVGSRDENKIIHAYFTPGGHLYVQYFLNPKDYGRNLGGRSSGINRA
jgi:hypothetical protein